MRKSKILCAVALMMAVVMTLTGCAFFNKVGDFVNGIFHPSVELTDATLSTEKLIDFANGANADVLFESDGWTNGDVFNVVWKKSNVKYEDGLMKLGITEEKATAWVGDAEVEFNYTAGEARTQNYYHYGDFAVSMKPSSNPGTASTFFTCTGPYDTKFVLDENGDYVLDENGERTFVENPHDEIDIEFLGTDTTHVQFNFFVNGVGGNEYMYNLGFDASEDFHTYGYRWAPDSITWFVDGEPVYKVTTDTSVKSAGNVRVVDKLPSTPGRILTNYWCGTEGAIGWMGRYTGPSKDNGTEYQWIATSAQGAPLNPPEEPDEGMTGIDWSAIDAIAPTFDSTELYTVVNEGNASNVTYSEVGGSSYINVEMDITEASRDKNYLHLTVTNNAQTACRFRVNVVDMELVNAGAQNMSTNISATVNGEVAFTDLSWGGSFFDLAAGETYEIVISFSGVVEKLQLMPDSSKNDSSINAGDITVQDIKFAKVGEIEIPDDPDPQPTPDNPVSGDLTATINGVEVTFAGNVTDGYGVNVNDENNTVNVTYNAILGNSYKNIWANVSSIAGTKNIFTMKVTNNGTAAVQVRIDIESQTQITANTTACNVSATQDGSEVYTDTTYGGSMFTVEAGATATLEVVYDASKLPTNVKIMIDSCQWDDSTSHAGDITISEMEFKGEYVPTEPNPNPNPNPAEGESLTFTAEENTGYTVDGTQIVNIKYNGAGNTWKPVTADVAALAAGKDTFTVTIKNNGTMDARVRFDVQGTTWVATGDGSGTDACNVSAVGGDVWTDLAWGGSTLTVAAGAEVTLVITYNGEGDQGAVKNILVFVDSARGDGATYNSDITLSGMSFTKAAAGEEPQQPAEGDKLTFATDSYTITPNNAATDTLTVTYSGVSGGTYANVCANVAEIGNNNNTFSITIKNNGNTTVRVRIDIKATNTVGNTNICNTTATGGGAWTDLEWGGSFVDVAAGAEVTVTVTYSTNHGEGKDFGPVTELLLYFDTSTYGDTSVYSGNLTLTNFKFSTAE